MNHHKYITKEFPVEFAKLLDREKFYITIASIAIKRINDDMAAHEKTLLIEIFDQFLESKTESGQFYSGAQLNALVDLKSELLTRRPERAKDYDGLLEEILRTAIKNKTPLFNLITKPFAFVAESERGPTQFSVTRVLQVYHKILKSMSLEEAWATHRCQHIFFERIPRNQMYRRYIMAKFLNPA